MSNDEGMTKSEIRNDESQLFRHSGFDFLLCFVLRHSTFLVLHFEQQHRDIHVMPHFIGRAAIKQVADEPVPVRAHGD